MICKLRTYVLLPLLLMASLVKVTAAVDSLYFQQQADFRIQVKLDVQKKQLKGHWEMLYVNNSFDDLNRIYIHLWANAYKNSSTAFAQESDRYKGMLDAFSGSIDSLDFKVGEKSLEWTTDTANGYEDIAILYLTEPLKAGDSIKITSPFKIQMPPVLSRMGYRNGTFQVSQWYPKPAVYDQDGWHPMYYLDQGEFYSEFGSYDVFIEVPSDYVVAATGDLQDTQEKKWLKDRAKASREVIRKYLDTTGIFEPYINDGSLFKSHYNHVPSDEWKTLHYKAENVHDFAFFADRTWLVRDRTFYLENGQKVQGYVMNYPKYIGIWQKAVDNLEDAIKWYSQKVGPYPYSTISVVEGALNAGGGMEYPTVGLIGSNQGNAQKVEQTIVHEVGHNWFYGILASNERDHPYMDEGLNSFYERWYLDEKYDGQFHYVDSRILRALFGTDVIDFDEVMYYYQAKRMADQPMNLGAEKYTALNYGSVVYYKSAVVFNYLKEYLGEAVFDSVMQGYYKDWQFKHPQPMDLNNAFSIVKKDLGFFFDDILKETAILDYKLVGMGEKTVTKDGKRFKELMIKNKGQIQGPFSVSSIKNDTIVETIWFEGFFGSQSVLFPYSKKVDAYQIDAEGVLPDINNNNNYYRVKGWMKHADGIRLRPLFNIEDPRRKEIVFAPMLGYNASDKLMLGLGAYNGFMYEKPFEITVAPLVGSGSQEFNGTGRLAFNIKAAEGSSVRNMVVGMNLTTFNYGLYAQDLDGDGFDDSDPMRFIKFMPFARFNFRNNNLKSNVVTYLMFRSVFLNKEVGSIDAITRTDQVQNFGMNVLSLDFFKQDYRSFNPYKVKVGIEMGDAFVKTQLDWTRTFSYLKNGKGLEMRMFFGHFLMDYRHLREGEEVWDFTDIQYHIAGGSGSNDYLFDQVFVDRSITGQNIGASMWTQHRYVKDGGFRVMTSVGRSSDWLWSSNLTFNIGQGNPVKFFTDIGTTPEQLFNDLGEERVLWNLGAQINLGPLRINLPLAYSNLIRQDIENDFSSGANVAENKWSRLKRTLTFNLNITEFNPLRLREKLLNL